ncbi:hypothetical protein E2C01_099389 [Portunus trituberculatus]|uniref:Uncharacterized protein n=1 Tax=Portunus trituberculatus TaxID=210409 RepID=A0A5B7KF90_PORTR|nr:hypothetical protein [Portunus trituberculatus]
MALANTVNSPLELYDSYTYQVAAQSILREDVIAKIKQAFTGEKVILTGLESQLSYPLAKIRLQCPFISGEVVVAIKPGELPVPEVHLVLGNDLAGNLAVPNLIVLDSPLTERPGGNIPSLLPNVCSHQVSVQVPCPFITSSTNDCLY